MSQQEVFAVIDLGNSSIRGLIANKLPSGEVSPIAYEIVPSEGCIRHGAVYNIDGTASRIKKILEKLNERLEDNYLVRKLYVGIGSQSLRSQEEIIRCEIGENGEEVTAQHLEEIENAIAALSYPHRTVVDCMPPYFEIDGKIEALHRGIVCKELIVHVSLITVKSGIYNNIRTVVENRLGLKLAGVLATPLCEAHVSLSDDQRRLGSVYVNIGGGSTSVVIYRDGVFRRLRVLPFGGISVTKDLETLRLTREEAENIKINYASATTYADRDQTFETTTPDGFDSRTMRVVDVNRIVSARMREIIANVVEIVKNSGVSHNIGAGYVFAGGGAQTKRLDEMLRSEIRTFTFNTQISHYLDRNNVLGYEPEILSAVALAFSATENCVEAQTTSLSELISNSEQFPLASPKRPTERSSSSEDPLFAEENDDDLLDEGWGEAPKEKKGKRDLSGWFRRVKGAFDSVTESFTEKQEEYDDDELE